MSTPRPIGTGFKIFQTGQIQLSMTWYFSVDSGVWILVFYFKTWKSSVDHGILVWIRGFQCGCWVSNVDSGIPVWILVFQYVSYEYRGIPVSIPGHRISVWVLEFQYGSLYWSVVFWFQCGTCYSSVDPWNLRYRFWDSSVDVGIPVWHLGFCWSSTGDSSEDFDISVFILDLQCGSRASSMDSRILLWSPCGFWHPRVDDRFPVWILDSKCSSGSRYSSVEFKIVA